jgi:hypothetical protein
MHPLARVLVANVATCENSRCGRQLERHEGFDVQMQQNGQRQQQRKAAASSRTINPQQVYAVRISCSTGLLMALL